VTGEDICFERVTEERFPTENLAMNGAEAMGEFAKVIARALGYEFPPDFMLGGAIEISSN
jgi:hypothetical protein